jgi:(p)ppGpp synthase/HD superfamily hydrolase
MTEDLTLERAKAIASKAHASQVDKAGRPYIEHPLAVMRLVEGDDAKIVAVLHDVLEDTQVTVDELRAAGASERQIAALKAVTKQPGEPYRDAVRRALADPIGRVVKIADHDNNTDPNRVSLLSKEDAERLHNRYAEVKDLIEAARIIEA